MLWLICRTGSNRNEQLKLKNKREYIIGRAPDCDFQVDDKKVSRWHCKLMVKDGRIFLEDMKSANGVRIGKHKVEFAAVLTAADSFRIGLSEFIISKKPAAKGTRTLASRKPPRLLDVIDIPEGLLDESQTIPLAPTGIEL